eukprot:7857983-Lingulodinium_polyedra.AAC.1
MQASAGSDLEVTLQLWVEREAQLPDRALQGGDGQRGSIAGDSGRGTTRPAVYVHNAGHHQALQGS